ncbi:hypothetical protein Aph01nite_34490 [Acrocarpospora phusangensis]|uniref:Uncharacterized protein n=1 Tax=Acrocarpospora phusangensis TaxID=1070424 RepID=A0A919Q9R5_9ACTN|nr:hypothetical protein Aph01nite_34490 [Acrocarpospora phusangensis]
MTARRRRTATERQALKLLGRAAPDGEQGPLPDSTPGGEQWDDTGPAPTASELQAAKLLRRAWKPVKPGGSGDDAA